jgi:minor histocompatibility antigen H13
MKARAQVSSQAIIDALSDLEPSATRGQMGEQAADAASLAYDSYADRELRQRERSTDGSGDGEAGDKIGEGRLPVSEAVLEQRPYFTAVAVSYVAGLVAAFAANGITHLGQPALLYIVPCTLGAVISTAVSRDELWRLWNFTDVSTFGMPAEALRKAEEKKKADR